MIVEILIGMFTGLAIGATGVGGGTLTTPALILLLRFSPPTAVATALAFSAVVKIAAGFIYIRRKQVDFRILAYLLCGGLPGVVLGSVFLGKLYTHETERWISSTIGAVIAVTAALGLFRHARPMSSEPSRVNLLPWAGFPIGLETGFSSAGAGALGSVLLLNVTTLSPAAVVGTDLLFGMITSAIGGAVHAFSGTCNWTALAILAPAGLAGTILGAQFSRLLPSQFLRPALRLWAAFMGILLIYNRLISPT